MNQSKSFKLNSQLLSSLQGSQRSMTISSKSFLQRKKIKRMIKLFVQSGLNYGVRDYQKEVMESSNCIYRTDLLLSIKSRLIKYFISNNFSLFEYPIAGMSQKRVQKTISMRGKLQEESTDEKIRLDKGQIKAQELKVAPNEEGCIFSKVYDSLEKEEKIIPGYNFESLFRKKSHIRLARKKNKEQPQKRSLNSKAEGGEKEARNIQKGHWTTQENKLYHWFLELHSKHFVLKYLRRTDKIFKSMAIFIQTREAEQCRSHHQKMEKKYHSFYQILVKLRSDFYHSTSPESLRHDLEQHGYKLKENTLITEAQLKNGQLMHKSDQAQENQQQSFQNNMSSLEGSLNSQSNLLGQNYQNGLAFKNLHY